jgi:GH24 family phage-related lysozyme (muramidase)
MALNNYGRALGQLAQESVKGSVKGFAMGIKGAALSEMPGLTAMYGLSRQVKNRADKLSDASMDDASVKEQRTNNVISLEMVRQLKSINNNVLQQTRISVLQANNAKQTAMFAEEAEREKSQRDKELLDAIKSLKGGAGASGILGSAGAGAAGGKGFLGSLIDLLQTASLLEALGVLGAGKYILDKLRKPGGGVPTTGGGGGKAPSPTTGGIPPTGGNVPTTGGGGKPPISTVPSPTGGIPPTGGNVPTTGGGGKPPQAPPTTGGGKVIPFPQGGRGGTPPTVPPTGGGGLLRGGAAVAARTLLRFVPYVGWALLAAEVGYEAYKIFGDQGGQGPTPPKPGGGKGGGISTTPIVEGAGGAAFGMYSRPGGATPGGNIKGSFNAAKDSQAASLALETKEQKRARGRYGVGDPRTRSTVGVTSEDTAKYITGKEGFSSTAYKDTNRMAIGYGHNITDTEIKAGQIDLGNGEFIKISGEGGKDTTVTREQANKLFSKDIKQYENIVIRAIGQEAYNKLSQNQRTAILSYVYNTGKVPAGFAEAIKAGNFANAAASIRNGIATASGEPDPERRKQLEAGLKIRRKKEGDLFDTAGSATSEQRSSSVVAKTSVPITASGGNNEMETQNASYRPAVSRVIPVSRSISASTFTPVSNVAIDVDAEIKRAAGSGYNDANTQRVIKDLSGQSTESRPSGSKTRSFVGPVQVEDKKANLILAQQLKTSKVVARETGVVAKSTTPRATRRQTTLLQRANQTFLNQFQNTTQRLLSKAIYDTLVVGAYGKEGSRGLVTKQQTQGEVYRGQQVAKLINLNRGTEKVLTGVFGKQIGKAYAPMVAQLGTAYLEAGATKVGRQLFSSILGNDKDSDALTGQILGNFAKGNKQAATEQLLYGLTGVASGPETIFAKYGFGSSQAGANFLGGYGAAQLTAPLAGMMGGNQPTYRGPNGQGTYGAGQAPMMQPATQQGAYYTGYNAKGNQQNFVNPEMMKLAIDADKASRESLPHIKDATWKQLDQAKADLKVKTEQYLEAKAGTAEFEAAQGARDQAQARLTERTNEILASKPTAVGGGSSAGGTFMSNMGNFAFDLGTSLVASKLTQGIKNPYLKAFANYGITSAANSFISPMIFGAKGISAGAAAATPGFFTAGNMSTLGSSLMPGSTLGFAGTAGNMLANAGYTTAGNFMSGVQSGMNISSGAASSGYQAAGMGGDLVAGEMVGQALPYAQAIILALKGDFKKAATSAAGTYIGLAISGGNPIIGAIGGWLGSLIGRKPKPAVLRVTSTSGNEVSAVTTFSKDSPPEAWSKFADLILAALLNSAKLMQQKSSAALPFVNIGIYVDSQSGINLALYQEGEATNSSQPKWNKNFGSIGNFKMGTGIVGMIEFMRDCLKEGKDTITADKLDKAAADLKTKDIKSLTNGLLNELKPGAQYDLTKGVGYDSGKPATTGRTVGAVKSRDTAGANTSTTTATTGTTTTPFASVAKAVSGALTGTISAVDAAITPGTKVNTSASLTSSSAETTNTNNSAPINSVVAVGGKTENDNSMNITNINQMSPMNDPWRQPLYNTSYQLAA